MATDTKVSRVLDRLERPSLKCALQITFLILLTIAVIVIAGEGWDSLIMVLVVHCLWDVSNGPLVRPSSRSLAPLTGLFCAACFARSLIVSLQSLGDCRTILSIF